MLIISESHSYPNSVQVCSCKQTYHKAAFKLLSIHAKTAVSIQTLKHVDHPVAIIMHVLEQADDGVPPIQGVRVFYRHFRALYHCAEYYVEGYAPLHFDCVPFVQEIRSYYYVLRERDKNSQFYYMAKALDNDFSL